MFFGRKLICLNRGLLVMNILMSNFRLQLIDCHSTFLTVLIEKDNQSLHPENMFPRKRFHTQSYEYLLVFNEWSISSSSIFEPASHRISHPSFTRVPSSSIEIFWFHSLQSSIHIYSITFLVMSFQQRRVCLIKITERK